MGHGYRVQARLLRAGETCRSGGPTFRFLTRNEWGDFGAEEPDGVEGFGVEERGVRFFGRRLLSQVHSLQPQFDTDANGERVGCFPSFSPLGLNLFAFSRICLGGPQSLCDPEFDQGLPWHAQPG